MSTKLLPWPLFPVAALQAPAGRRPRPSEAWPGQRRAPPTPDWPAGPPLDYVSIILGPVDRQPRGQTAVLPRPCASRRPGMGVRPQRPRGPCAA